MRRNLYKIEGVNIIPTYNYAHELYYVVAGDIQAATAAVENIGVSISKVETLSAYGSNNLIFTEQQSDE